MCIIIINGTSWISVQWFPIQWRKPLRKQYEATVWGHFPNTWTSLQGHLPENIKVCDQLSSSSASVSPPQTSLFIMKWLLLWVTWRRITHVVSTTRRITDTLSPLWLSSRAHFAVFRRMSPRNNQRILIIIFFSVCSGGERSTFTKNIQFQAKVLHLKPSLSEVAVKQLELTGLLGSLVQWFPNEGSSPSKGSQVKSQGSWDD